MPLITVIIDFRAAESCSCGTPTSLLVLPYGPQSFLRVLAEQVASLRQSESGRLVVMPTFSVGEDYTARIAMDCPKATVISSEHLNDVLKTCDPRDQVLVIDPGRWPLGAWDLVGLVRRYQRASVATHFICTGEIAPRARERVECDDAGRVTRVQRLFHDVILTEAVATGAFMTLATVLSLKDVRFSTASELRSALSERGQMSQDVPLSLKVADLRRSNGVLVLNEEAVTRAASTSKNGLAGLRQGEDCVVDSLARLVGPVVLHDRVKIGAGATVIGPCVIGSDCEVEADAVVAQAVLAPDTLVRSGVTLRHCIASGSCLTCPDGTAPRKTQGVGVAGVREPAPSSMGQPEAMRDRDRRRRVHLAIKRFADVSLSLAGLLILSPLFVVVAILVKLTSPGPVFFVHSRERREGREFPCLKFRTMEADAHEKQHDLYQQNELDGPQFKLRHDPRITRLGHFLRSTNIDELPQLINVLLGQMSLVGPRPSPFRENQICVPWRRARLSVRPGITGLWQICRSPDRSAGDFHEWIFYDIAYVRHFSVWLDLKILLWTVLTKGGRHSVPMSRLIRPDAQESRRPNRVAIG